MARDDVLVGRIIDKPWVVSGRVGRPEGHRADADFDHRVCDGGIAAGFLRFVADAIEYPNSLLADGVAKHPSANKYRN